MTDLFYTQSEMFTRFAPNTKLGEDAYNEIYRVTGDGAVRNDHLKSTLKQLRKAGYKVSKAKVSNESKEKLMSEIDDLLNQLNN